MTVNSISSDTNAAAHLQCISKKQQQESKQENAFMNKAKEVKHTHTGKLANTFTHMPNYCISTHTQI